MANESFHDCGNSTAGEDLSSNSSMNSTAGEALSSNSSMEMLHHCSFVVPEEGLYMIQMTLNDTLLLKGELLDMSWRSMYGHLPPAFWPLLVFYQVSLSMYTFYFVVWIVLCCYFYKELLQLQYYIAFIILLGLVEKLIYLVEFERFNRTAEEAAFGAVIFAEVVSALKRTSARILVIVVSVGFGIVKPRLGRTLYFLGAAGLLYFVFSASQGVHYRENRSIQKKNVTAFLALVLAIIDAIFFYWIFHSLVRTMRTLKLRKNTVKLSVYKSFTYTLLFALIASLLFAFWSLATFQLGDCIKNWRELWLDDVFWPLLFSLLLLMIMILWRPSGSNLRYAYSALNDGEEEDESREPMMNTEMGSFRLIILLRLFHSIIDVLIILFF